MHLSRSPIRHLKASHVSRGNEAAYAEFVRSYPGWDDDREALMRKAAIPGIGTGSLPIQVGVDFMADLHQLALIFRLQGARKVPHRLRLLTGTGNVRASWVAQGAAIPVTLGAYTATDLDLHKVAAIDVVSNELLTAQTVDAENIMAQSLMAATVARVDGGFLTDETSSGAPAPITAGVTPIASSGNTIANLDADMKAAIDKFISAGGTLSTASWITSERLAAHLGLMRSDGVPAYPGASGRGGSLLGLPLLVTGSAHIPGDSPSMGGDDLVLIDGSAVTYAESDPILSISTKGAIEMSSAPTGHTLTPTASSQVIVSMFQAEATALRAVVVVDWKLRRPGLVQVVADITL